MVKMSAVSTTPPSLRPGSATISRTRRCPQASVPTCTTRSTLAATVGTTNDVPMFSPASNGSVHTFTTASRALLAFRVHMAGSPLFNAISRSRHSSWRTSPTRIREGRIRRASFTSRRSGISPAPSRFGWRVCMETTSGSGTRRGRPSYRGPALPPVIPRRSACPVPPASRPLLGKGSGLSSLAAAGSTGVAGIAGGEVAGGVCHEGKFDIVVALHVIEETLEHEQVLWAAGDVGVEGDGEDGVVHLPIDPVELVLPQLLDVLRADEAVAVGAGLDEHHRRQVVEVPRRRDLNEVGLLAPDERLHPFPGGGRVIVDFGPSVTDPHVVRGVIVVHQRVVVQESSLQQDLVGDRRELPPRRHVADRLDAGAPLDELGAVVEDLGLLLAGHRDGVLVAVAVHPNLVTGGDDRVELLRKCLHGMAGPEPAHRHVPSLSELEQAGHADLTGKEAAGDVPGGVFSAVGAEPAADGVDVDADGHVNLPGQCCLLWWVRRTSSGGLGTAGRRSGGQIPESHHVIADTHDVPAGTLPSGRTS